MAGRNARRESLNQRQSLSQKLSDCQLAPLGSTGKWLSQAPDAILLILPVGWQ
jgi:hypothetical protein